MQINGTTHVHGPHGMNPPHALHRAQPARTAGSAQGVDQLDISNAAEVALQAADGGEIRFDRVNQLRAEIAAGTYETPEKLTMAVDRLFDEIG
jgi:negative regulator of flagellin synthesis FlgM